MKAKFALTGSLALLAVGVVPAQAASLEGNCSKAAKTKLERSYPGKKVEVLGTRMVHDAKLSDEQQGYYVTVQVGTVQARKVYDAYCTGFISTSKDSNPQIMFVRQR